MHKLIIDYERCTDCWQCEQLLHGFRSRCNGELMISPSSLMMEDRKASVDFVIAQCPNRAITLEQIGDR